MDSFFTSSLDLSQALEEARRAAAKGRQVLLDYFGRLKRVQEKHLAGLVSEADVESERLIKEHLTKAFPDWGFLGEEESFETLASLKVEAQKNGEVPRWIVDPLDGTTNYIHRLPIYCISIGLEWRGQILAGLIDVPPMNLTYSATIGGGSFVNDQPIRVSTRKQLKDSLLATGFFAGDKKALVEQLGIFSSLVGRSRGVRRAGAAAYDLCLVAEGVFDGFWEKNLKPWDVAAGVLLVLEAGGHLSNYQGEAFDLYGDSLVASNAHIHSTLVESIRKSSLKT